MCKRSFLSKLKDVAKSIPINANQIKKTASQKINSIYQEGGMDKIIAKTKEEMAQKQQILKQYSEKIKDISDTTGKELLKKTGQFKDSASQIKGNINLVEASSKLKQKILEYASPLKKQQNIKQLPKPQRFSAVNIAQRVLQKSEKLRDQMASNMIVQPTKGIFSKIFSSLYWRLLFALCLVTLIYVSPQLIKQIGDVTIQYKKLEKQEQEQRLNCASSPQKEK